MESRTPKIVILGNGPSLRDFDFRCLQEVDSLGMNAAYRYWERIGWYPTHYTCLDDQLIETHADAIRDLIVSGKVRSAFLIAKILDYHPDLIAHSNVFFLESFNKTRHARVAARGIPFIASLPFRESDPSKVTTGAYAMRYAAHLGYREIAVMGVDLRYVEIIPEARQADGIKLVMESTPSSNPNYFFDDYQRAGDKFNIPNPASHGSNLHVAAFEALANDVVQFAWPAQVFNANPKSILYDKAIFPYRDIGKFARLRKLAAVVVPATRREESQLLQNLIAWDQPRLAPSVGSQTHYKPDLVYAFSCAEDASLRQRLLDAVESTQYVRRSFDKVEVRFVALDSTLDYYERDYSRAITGKGFKSGPNEQFFELMSSLAGIGDFVFYMEADCAPLRQGWLDRLRALAEGDAESWVIGSLYRGIDTISDRFFLHLNGNALYRVGDAEFVDFVAQYWRPMLNRALDTVDRRLAYDCLLSHSFTDAKPSSTNGAWKLLQSIGHRFRGTAVIQNIAGAADQRRDPEGTLRRLLADEPDTYLVHGRQFTKLLHERLAPAAGGATPSQLFSWADVLGPNAGPNELPYWRTAVADSLPRLLIFDITATGSSSATGQVKQRFLQGWPAERLLQVYESADRLLLQRFSASTHGPADLSPDGLLQACLDFGADVVYVRPVDSARMMAFVDRYFKASKTPLVIHMMDDWPERLRSEDPHRFATADHQLRRLIERASERFSISQLMADVYRKRYGQDFIPLANGVDVSAIPAKDWRARGAITRERPFVIRYMGGLARDMNYDSVLEVARAVETMARSLPVRFEIYTMDWYLENARSALSGWQGVTVHGLVAPEDYIALLSESDALVIAYNFDEASRRYIGLSMANKLPECLAVGVPVLAYGPASVATIAYLAESECACVVTQQGSGPLHQAIADLVNQPARCQSLGASGRQLAARNHAQETIIQTFRSALVRSASRQPSTTAAAVDSRHAVPAVASRGRPSERAHRSGKIITTQHFTAVSDGRWRCSAGTGTDKGRSLWLAVFPHGGPTAGRSFSGTLRLTSDRNVALKISLGRHGQSVYEGTETQVDLGADVTRSVSLSHVFTHAHEALKLQIEVLQVGCADSVELVIEDAVIASSPAAMEIAPEDLSFTVANRLFRAGHYERALAIYLRLHGICPLVIYGANARFAASRLGMAAASIDALLAHDDRRPHAMASSRQRHS